MCPAVGACSAAGGYDDSHGDFLALVLSESSGTWRAAELALPANGAGTDLSHVNRIACVSAGRCLAGGLYDRKSGYPRAFIATEANGTWKRAVAAPVPADANRAKSSSIEAVACPGRGHCVAAGDYTPRQGISQGMVLQQSGGKWTAVHVKPPPGGVSAGEFDSISCPSVGNCTAVGAYFYKDQSEPLIVTETNGKWSAGVAPTLPSSAAPASGQDAYLASVSCAAAGECTAVGSYVPTAGGTRGVVLREHAGTWVAGRAAPLPSDAAKRGQQGGFVTYGDNLGCSGASACTASGAYTNAGGSVYPLVIDQSGGRLTPEPVTLPGNAAANTVGRAPDAACPAAGQCVVIGRYLAPSGFQGFVDVKSGGIWQAATRTPLPANAARSGNGTDLLEISCAAVGSCVAVGTYSDSAGYSQPLILTSSGH